MLKKISIIIPVYKVEQFIRNCLVSIFTQDLSLDAYEVIVVNDGTPDNSMNIVSEFANTYRNLKIINQENQGLSIARNNGLNMACGKYVWFVDSDDWIKEDCLNKIIELIDKYESDVFSMPILYVFEQKGKINTEDFFISKIEVINGKEYLQKYPFGASVRFIMRKSFLLKNNLIFHPNLLHEDAVFGIKLLYMANQVCILNQSFYNYRIRNDGSIMSSWKKKNSEDLVLGYKILNSFAKDFIDDKSENSKYNSIIINNLVASITFARREWVTRDFRGFYSENRSFISKKGLNMMKDNNIGLRYRIKGFIIYLSPLLFCIISTFYSKRQNS